ncbi:hypothetical protein MHYP_G00196920 [Metynnis hypsauchen]
MSDTQPTVTERFPKKANRTSSILSRDHPPDKRPKSDKPAIPPVHDSTFDSTVVLRHTSNPSYEPRREQNFSLTHKLKFGIRAELQDATASWRVASLTQNPLASRQPRPFARVTALNKVSSRSCECFAASYF